MADFDDEVGEDFVEHAEGFGVGFWDLVGGGARGRGGTEGVEEVADFVWVGGNGLVGG